MLNLPEIAHREMLAAGFAPDFADNLLREADAAAAAQVRPNGSDRRDLLWSSIDNSTSRDLDQIEVAHEQATGEISLTVAIADVDSLVPKGSLLDQHALQNGASIYLGIATFPLFPPQLSFGATSLLQDQDRSAVLISFELNGESVVGKISIETALVRNRAKLAYETVGPWLENSGPAPDLISKSPELAAQIRLQAKAAERLRAARIRSGALEFASSETEPVMADGKISALQLQQQNAARDLIEDLMIAANSAIAQFLIDRGSPSLQRVVRTPARWPRIVELAAAHGGKLPAEPDAVALSQFLAQNRTQNPESFPDLSLAVIKLLGPGEYVVVQSAADALGHFGLAVHDYAHGTAPNRRYPDLVTQRLLKAAIASQPSPYSADELQQIAARCNERAAAARKLERLMRKISAAIFLSTRIGETFDGIVTGASAKGVFVRLRNPPAEGRVVQNEAGLDVGASVRVRLLRTIPDKGFIDFARVS